jgi:replication-associated recombination protein RarA
MSFTQNDIYRWDDKEEYYVNQGCYEPMSKDSVFGFDDFFEGIAEDIRALDEKRELLKKIGRSASLNYLLHGEPGTGKTSTVKVIGSTYRLDIYIASFNGKINEKNIQRIIKPVVGRSVFLLVEDFDRYLESEESSKQISTFLNALDGVEPADGVIRFFTANDTEVIANNRALISRIKE